MDDSRLIRSELAYWHDGKTVVELYEGFIRFLPVGEKPIEIKYGNIASCKRYMKELLITSKGASEDGFYGIHHIPLKFENFRWENGKVKFDSVSFIRDQPIQKLSNSTGGDNLSNTIENNLD